MALFCVLEVWYFSISYISNTKEFHSGRVRPRGWEQGGGARDVGRQREGGTEQLWKAKKESFYFSAMGLYQPGLNNGIANWGPGEFGAHNQAFVHQTPKGMWKIWVSFFFPFKWHMYF